MRLHWTSFALIAGILILGVLFQSGHTMEVSDSKAHGIGQIRVGMSERQLIDLGIPWKRNQINLEGDNYTQLVFELSETIKVTATLDLSNIVHRVTTSSPGFADDSGVGIGTQLSMLKQVYPDGKLIGGFEEGTYLVYTVIFDVGTSVFVFDHQNIPDICLINEDSCICELDEEVVVSYFVHGFQ